MVQKCPEGEHLDKLVRRCVSCSLVCQERVVPSCCSEFCVAWRCKATSGHFYDRLLKKCLKCSELCGSHPQVCSPVCNNAGFGVTQAQTREILSAVQPETTRGRAAHGPALYSDVLLYSLLGLSVTVLVCALTAAVLLLFRRAKHQQHDVQKTNKHGQSSKDSLMARAEEVCRNEAAVDQNKGACLHCYSAHALYQQAGPQQPAASTYNHHHDNGALNHPVNVPDHDNSRTFRIICSPTQSSA